MGSYIEGARVSEGASTLVVRGRRTGDGMPVVLKILRREHRADDELAMFRREHRVTCAAQGEQVIRVLELVEYGESLAIVLEDIDGVSLDTMIGDLCLKDVLTIGVQLARALAGIHRKGVIHKDVSPGNTIWNPHRRELRLIDFGISTQLTPELRTTRCLEQGQIDTFCGPNPKKRPRGPCGGPPPILRSHVSEQLARMRVVSRALDSRGADSRNRQ